MRIAVLAGVLLALGGEPAPNEPIPREPARLAHTLAVTSRDLDEAIDGWRGAGNAPRDVELLALYHQRIYRLLRVNDRLARAVFRLLPSALARAARAIVGGGQALRGLTPAREAR